MPAASENQNSIIANDGWIYIGDSLSNGRPLFVAPADTEAANWDEAMKAAQELKKQGKTDARVPSSAELTQIFNNKANIPGLDAGVDVRGSNPASWYWSSTTNAIDEGYAFVQDIKGGNRRGNGNKKSQHNVRLVRS